MLQPLWKIYGDASKHKNTYTFNPEILNPYTYPKEGNHYVKETFALKFTAALASLAKIRNKLKCLLAD